MNMKTLMVLALTSVTLSVAAEEQNQNQNQYQNQNQNQNQNNNNRETKLAGPASACVAELAKIETEKIEQTGFNETQKECTTLKQISERNKSKINDTGPVVSSMKGEIQCRKPAGYTLDYDYCSSAAQALNFVVNAEAAMDLQQQVRTDIKNKNIQEDANKKMATGDGQTGMLDASIESNTHQKRMYQEKTMAYSAAVAGLMATYHRWPSAEKLLGESCKGLSADCKKHFESNQKTILANENQKGGLIAAITTYVAKGLAAGIAMKQFDTKAKAVEAAKKTVEEETGDVLIARCEFNPTDPLCSKPGNRVAGQNYTGSEFTFGESGNNTFGSGATDGTFGEEGEASNLPTDNVAAINNPFEDEAKKANGILDPAAAASMQAGTPSSGGGGGAGGGGGGGSASLGSDLEGADKDANKEASLKATKASGNYNSAGGGGFAAIKGGKDDKNPFASLFDAKSAGGIEEDRSIASGDIDGQASGLFQKISKRYGQIQADKRIEANNLE